MTTLAEDIADWLESRGLGTKGVDIFQSELLDSDPDDAILIRQGGGAAADRSHDLRRVRNSGIAVTIRAASDGLAAGNLLAENVYDALLDLTNTSINGRVYIGTVPLGEISDLGQDEKDRWKWSMNFLVKRS